MKLKSRHFGEIEVEDDKIIEFGQGMIGFPQAKRFCLLSQEGIAPYQWLHAVDQPDLAFLVAPQLLLYPQYELTLSDCEAARLRFSESDQAVVLLVVTLPADPKDATMNLLAPVVIHEAERLGAQVINERHGYTVRHRIQDEMRSQAKEGTSHAGANQEKEAVADAG